MGKFLNQEVLKLYVTQNTQNMNATKSKTFYGTKFLPTLVALHLTPVSKWVGVWVVVSEKRSLELASLLFYASKRQANHARVLCCCWHFSSAG